MRIELEAPPGTEIPLGLHLQAFWDGAPTPQVDTPLDDFFGASLGPGARSLAFGQNLGGDHYYSYFPMPFEQHARIVVRNDGDAAVAGWELNISSVDYLTAVRPLHFYATANAARATDASDYVILDATGTGHVVGVVLTSGCAESGRCQLPQIPGVDGSHLEGDEHIAVDGSRYPQIHGTGLEDFFNGGFYYIRGPFTLPTHGNPAQAPTTSLRRPGLNLRSSYRLLLGDAVPFSSQLHALKFLSADDADPEWNQFHLLFSWSPFSHSCVGLKPSVQRFGALDFPDLRHLRINTPQALTAALCARRWRSRSR